MNINHIESKQLNKLINDILNNKISVIYITGDVASGKTYMANIMSYILAKNGISSSILCIDNFLLDRSYRHSPNTKLIYDLDLLKQLRNIKNKNKINYPIYNYQTGQRQRVDNINLNQVKIIEGCLLTNDINIRTDKIIYINKTKLTQLFNLLKRDKIEKSYNILTILKKYKNSRYLFEKFIKTYKTKANYIFKNCYFNNYMSTYKHGNNIKPQNILNITQLEKIKKDLKKNPLTKKSEVYNLITHISKLVIKKINKPDFLKNHIIFSRGNLSLGCLGKNSDWDITIYANHSLYDTKTAYQIIKAIEYCHPYSKNTGGILNSAKLLDNAFDPELLYTTSMLNTDLITGQNSTYQEFKDLFKKKIKTKENLIKLYRQTNIRRQLYTQKDIKNGFRGMRDLQTLYWLHQIDKKIINNYSLSLGQSILNRLLVKAINLYINIYGNLNKKINQLIIKFIKIPLGIVVSYKIKL